MNKRLSISHIDELPQKAQEIIALLRGPRVVCMRGPMGAGKTTLVKALIAKLGAIDAGSSPTFALINNYESESSGTIHHLDLYRLNHSDEALDIGIEDLIYEKVWCFIEWPEKIEHLLDDDAAEIRIEVGEFGVRELIVNL